MNEASPRLRWSLLFAAPRDGAENMARDMALLNRARASGECVLSVYTWSRPTISFGRNQATQDYYNEARIAVESVDAVRRPTGGRAILHNREATYSIAGPDSYAPSLRETYNRINSILVQALRKLGAPAELALPGNKAPRPDQAPCFNEPVQGEVIACGRKLAGSAQYRENGAFLQHGSILLADDQDILRRLFCGEGIASTNAPVPATLTELLGRPVTAEEVANELFSTVRHCEDPDATVLEESEVRPEALRLRSLFIDPLWTWRR